MLSDTLITLFTRDLEKLKKEINSYTNEDDLWILAEGISNAAGNLCLHLVGNLNHFIGAILGKTGYIRKRDLEFSQKNVPVSELTSLVDDTIVMIENTLNTLSIDDFQENYPQEVFGKPMTTEYFMLHLAMHLAYHLGQVNYHRRLLTKNA